VAFNGFFMMASSRENTDTQEHAYEDAPNEIDIGGVEEVTPPQAPPVRLDPLSQAGVGLAKLVLSLIAGVLVIIFALAAVDEFHTPQFMEDAYVKALSASLSDAKIQNPVSSDAILTKIIDARSAAREFWLKLAQLILLNLLLPVLTAILGYTFGSKQSGRGTY